MLSSYASAFRKGLFQGRVRLGRLGTESEVSAAFISVSCLRVDGAVPNAKRVADRIGSGQPTPAFDGFHLAKRPKVLE